MPRKRVYTEEFLTRMTDEERTVLRALATKAHVSLSRLLVESTLTAQLPSREMILLRQQAIFHVRRVGQNLNQVVTVLRMDFGQAVANYTELTDALRSVSEAMRVLGATWTVNQEIDKEND